MTCQKDTVLFEEENSESKKRSALIHVRGVSVNKEEFFAGGNNIKAIYYLELMKTLTIL